MTAQAASPEWTGGTASSFAGGTGTESDPYLVATGEQLAYFSQSVANGNAYAGQYIKLTQDIVLGNRAFPRIGTGPDRSFKGTFDGASFQITGLNINQSGTNCEGLFGYAEAGSVIRNLGVAGSVGGASYTGAIAGRTNGLIENCTSACTVTADWQPYHGGIAGYVGTGGAIRNCSVTATVSGSHQVGGIAGYTDGLITDCSANVQVLGTWGDDHGGIAGSVGASGVISNCVAGGDIRGGIHLGGVAGRSEGTIRDCEFSSTLTGTNSYVGGIVGYSVGAGSVVTGCIVNAAISGAGSGYTGGVAGRSDGTISDCVVHVSLTAPNSYIGGVVGYAYGSASSITGCTVSGTVVASGGSGYLGGVAGQADGVISDCEVSAAVSGNGQQYVGGVAGYVSTGAQVSKSVSSGNVSGNTQVGGIAGYTNGDIEICINTGSVASNNGHAGGVAGEAGASAAVSNSFNSGDIDGGGGQGGVGGIIGYVNSETVLHNNLNKGEVEGSQYVGSITGNALNAENAWNNYYYDTENSPDGTSGGDVSSADAAVPVGDLTWEEICALLNTDSGEEEDVWSQDLDDDGVPKPQTTPPPAEPSNAVVKEGEYYTASSLGTGTSANITSDSVFTVVFHMNYSSSCALASQTVRLSGGGAAIDLPVNTSVIMEADGVYYYKSLAEEAQGITLGEFIRMGSETEHYPQAQAASGEGREYLFIFDFSRTGGIAAGTLKVELLYAGGSSSGTMPSVTTAGKNTYTLSVSGGTNSFTAGLSETAAAGYDYKTDGASYVFECSLQKDGVAMNWPVGTKINGASVSSDLPYSFTAAAFGDTAFSLDFEDCGEPPALGSYTVFIKVYACPDGVSPRGGFLLAGGSADVTLTPASACGIKAAAAERVFDRSASEIPVHFTVETVGSGTVKSTLQYKYGSSYADISGQSELPVTVSGGGATLTIPADSARGTYRFVLALYDGAGVKKAETVENVIVK